MNNCTFGDYVNRLVALTSLVLFSGCGESSIHTTSSGLDDLRSTSIEQPNSPLPSRGLEQFRDLIGNATVVGLGESRHDTCEQFEIKTQLSKHLIHDLGFRTLIIEESFSHALALDAYVTSGQGDIREILNELAGWYLWDTEEMVRFMLWVRQFNATAPPEQMVRVHGMDITAPASGIRQAIAVANDLAPEFDWNDREFGLEHQAGDFWPSTWRRYSILTADEKASIGARLEHLRTFLAGQLLNRSAGHSDTELELLLMLTDVGIRGHHMFSSTDIAEVGMIREQGMASAVKWILDQNGEPTRAIVWTHNLHAAKSTFQMPSMVAGDLTPMGVLLHKEFGEKYLAIGGTFGGGHFTPELPPGERSFPPMDIDTVDGAISKLGYDSVLLDFQDQDPSSAVAQWLAVSREWRAQDGVALLSPGTAFDAVYYVDQVSRAQPTPLALQKFQSMGE